MLGDLCTEHPWGKKAETLQEKSTTVMFSYPKFHLHLPDRRFLLASSKCLSAEKIYALWTQLLVVQGFIVLSRPVQEMNWNALGGSEVKSQMQEWEGNVTGGLYLCLCWHYLPY